MESLLSMAVYPAMRRRTFLVLVALIALAAGLAQTSVGNTMLRKAGLVEEPASYTSLAFLHPQSLPEQLKSKRHVPIAFVIHNAGSTPRVYEWSVLLAQGPRTHQLAAGNVRVASRHGAIVMRSLQVLCTRGRMQIVVMLTHPAQSIDAWAECLPRRK